MRAATETKATETHVALTRDAIEPLVRHEPGVLVSLYMPIQFQTREEAHQNAHRLRKLVHTAEAELLTRGITEAEARAFLYPVEELIAGGVLNVKAPAMAVFAAVDFFRVFELPAAVAEQVSVGERFEIKPLLGLISAGPFYVLALSQNHVRLLRVTAEGVHEVVVHGAPENLFAAFGQEHFQRQMQFHTAAQAHMDADATRISHGGPRETKDRVVEFLRKVDHGMTAAIHDRTSPMLLAGVNYLLPLYHEVNTYPTLLEEAIPGNADYLSAKELLAAGRAAIGRHIQAQNEVHLATYRELQGTERASSNTRHVVAAADQGRVLFLFVPENTTEWGTVDDAEIVHVHAQAERGDEDLVNRAALKTLARGGHVCVLPVGEFEVGARMAAVFRY